MIDISLPLRNGMVTYPGDAPYEEYAYKTHERDGLHITRVLMETHTGTHFDAPFHMIPNGKKVSDYPLSRFMGRATVVECDTSPIGPQNIPERHQDFILFKTLNSRRYDTFHTDFAHLSPEAAGKLVDDGTKLVGVDYLSVDAFRSPGFEVHRILMKADILIIEGLVLDQVNPGEYDLVCFPLNMSQDAAPCRAALL